MSDSIPRLYFSRNWEDPADFTTRETSEIQNRRDIQSLYTEIQTYLNHVLLPVLEAGNWGGGGGGSGGSGDMTGYLPLSGGTMLGVLRLYRNPAFTDEAATKQYVDNASARVMTDTAAGYTSAIQQSADAIRVLVDENGRKIGELIVRAAGIESSVTDLDDDVNSRIQQLADSISMEVSGTQTDGDRVYAGITLRIGENNYYGEILLNGNVDVSGQLSADALYAPYGEISDLLVDRLSTSRRIVKYLAGDESDDRFIRIHDEVIEFVAGINNGGTAQARNPQGEPLYWPMNVSGLPRGADGYPLNSGTRVFTTTEYTEWPVGVYTYTEQVKRAIRFERNVSGIYEPKDTYGAGNAAGNNRGFIEKGTEGFDLTYITPVGKAVGIRMGAGGYVDITGLRRTTALNFSNFDAGTFTENLEGESAPRGFTVSFDGDDRPVSISDGENTMTISW